MVSFNLKVLAKFGLCSNCSQKLHGCSLASARQIFASACVLACSHSRLNVLDCAKFLLLLLWTYFLYINDKSVMTWLRENGWNIRTFGFSLSSIAQSVTVAEARVYYRANARSSTDKYFGYCFIHYHISSAQQAFCFLKCSLLARKICQMLVLAKIDTAPMLADARKDHSIPLIPFGIFSSYAPFFRVS